VLIELYADGIGDKSAERVKMALQSPENGEKLYKAQVCTKRPVTDYTIRIIPDYEDISVPLENNLILWQR